MIMSDTLIETIKMNYLINSRENNNFYMNTLLIIFLTVLVNYDIHKIFLNIKNLFLQKNSFFLEGKRTLKNNDYITRTDSLFSDRFLAFWNFINKNSINNPDIYSFKEYAEHEESRYTKCNKFFSQQDDIFIVNQYKKFTISTDLYCIVTIEKDKIDEKQQSMIEIINIEIFSYILSKKHIQDFLDNLVIQHKQDLLKIRHNKKFIYNLIGHKNSNNNNDDDYRNQWEEYVFTSTRNFNNIFFDKKNNLLNKLDFFENNKTWYEYEGHPYTFGLGLYGPPGTGKTSIIKCIANKLDRHIIIIPLSKIQTQTEFNQYFFESRYNRLNNNEIGFENKIIVFEDIDCMSDIVKQREDINDMQNLDNNKCENDKLDKNIFLQNKLLNNLAKKIDKDHNENIINIDFNKNQNDKITLSFILNIIDGIRETPGRILIITSNNYNSLDKALIRPGRIDYTLEMKNASIEVINQMYYHYYKKNIPNDILEKLEDYKISPAKIVNIRLENNDPNDFLNALVNEFL